MMINRILYRISRSIRETYYLYFPDYNFLSILENNLVWGLTIETCNICNANCIFCGYQYQKRKKKIMPENMYKKIIDDYDSIGGGKLGFGGPIGDPLLDPFLLDRIHYARQFSNIKIISFMTNCINLHNIGVKNLLTSGLNNIFVSTSGFDLKAHNIIYRSNKAEVMKNNLINLVRMNRELGKPCKITIGLRTYQPINEVLNDREFREIAEMSDSVLAQYYYDDWGGRIKPTSLPKGMKIRPLILSLWRRKAPCSMLYGSITILSDGTATMCGCRDINGDSELVLGNIKESSLLELYKSYNLKNIRKYWLNDKRIPNICQDCRHYNPFTYSMLKEVRINAKC